MVFYLHAVHLLLAFPLTNLNCETFGLLEYMVLHSSSIIESKSSADLPHQVTVVS